MPKDPWSVHWIKITSISESPMNTALPVTMGWRLKNDNDSAYFRIQKKIVRRISILHQLEEVKTAPLSKGGVDGGIMEEKRMKE